MRFFKRLLFVAVISLFANHLPAAIIDIAPVGRIVEIQSPGEIFNWSVKIPDLTRDQTASWQVQGWYGEPLSPSTPISLSNGEAKIQYKPIKVGWQELVVTVHDKQGLLISVKKRGFISGQTRKQNVGDFKYGVAAHLLRTYRKPELFQADLTLIDKLGVVYYRDDMLWDHLQPTTANEWKWEPFDVIVQELTNRGIEIDGILAFSAKWASTDQTNGERIAKFAAPQMEPWITFVRQFVGRYKGRIKYWEIWNEPDIGAFWRSTTDEFTTLFSATAKTIREVYPEAKIINGGFAVQKREPNVNFIDEFLPKADKKNWDIFAYHDYHTFDNLFERRKYISNLYEKYKLTIPVWMNEGGLNSVVVGMSERNQAIILTKKLATAPSLNMDAYIVYDLKNDGTNPNEPEHNYGLVWNDYSAKPGFAAYQTLLRLLGGRNFVKTLRYEANDVWAQIYNEKSGDKSQVAFVWSEGNLGTALVWISQLRRADVLDIMGNSVASHSVDEGTLVPIGDVPVYIQGKPDDDWSIKQVLTPPSVIVLSAGAKGSALLSFANPFSYPVRVIIEPSDVSKGIRPFKKSSVEVNSHENISIPVSFECDDTLPAKPLFKLTCRVGEASFEIQLPAITAQSLPLITKSVDAIDLKPDEGKNFELQTAESIFNIFNAEPSEEKHWHGAEDLSANARLAYTQDSLWITVQVKDDVHSQKESGEFIWKGDSLQLAIQTDPNQKTFLQLGFALTDSQKQCGWISEVPEKSFLSVGSLRGNLLPYSVRRDKNITTYAIKIPWNALGLTEAPKAFHFNFIVHDDDGSGRRQWLKLSDGMGMGRSRLNPNLFPWFTCGK